ncbi:MAG TPA: hypothetical protein VGG73_23110 [Vicinamibacterales bacterium]
MSLRSAGRDQLVADADRKRKIGESITVEVAKFTVADAKLDAAEAMRFDDDAWPAGDFALNLC